MAGSFSQELEDLLNPLPKFADPEDDADEATKARVIERFNEDDDDDDEDGVGLSYLASTYLKQLQCGFLLQFVLVMFISPVN
uniref:Uncharacterized protein n=1 Tax=Seriola dumerili TaxID=41447 RepID=A0A3B4T3Q3_SERDU